MGNNEKIELLKNLFSCLIENFEASYVIDGENLKNGRLSLVFEESGDDTRFVLRSEDSQVFTGLLNEYFIDQCRGDEYEDKELGAKLKDLAKAYYDVWLYENRNLKYWNYSQFGYKDFE